MQRSAPRWPDVGVVSLRRGERTPLQRRAELLDPSHFAWSGVQTTEDADLALRILAGT